MQTISIKNNGSITAILMAKNQPLNLATSSTSAITPKVYSGNTITLVKDFSKNIYASFKDNLKALIEATKTEGWFYISNINGVQPIDGNISMVGGATTDITPRKEGHGLLIDDFGRPDIDCDDYAKINALLLRLEEYLNNAKDQILGQPIQDGKSAKIYGLHKQYEAATYLWNNRVHNIAVKTNVSYQNKQVFIQISFTNNTINNFTECTIPITINLNFGNQKLYSRFVSSNAYTDAGNTLNINPPADSSYSDFGYDRSEYKFTCVGNINSGATVTIQLQFDVSATDSTISAVNYVYELDVDNVKDIRCKLIEGLPVEVPADNEFAYFYENMSDFSYSTQSTGTVDVAPSSREYTKADTGTYIIKILSSGKSPQYIIESPSGADASGVVNVTFSGDFLKGDQFVFYIKERAISNTQIQQIVKGKLIVNTTLNDIPVSANVKGDVNRTKTVYIPAEDTTVGKLETVITPSFEVKGMDIEGAKILQGSINLGSVSIGSVSVGSVSVGSVSAGTINIGSFDISGPEILGGSVIYNSKTISITATPIN